MAEASQAVRPSTTAAPARPAASASSQSVTELVASAIADTQGLVRDEIALAQTEMKDSAKQAAKSSGMFVAAALFGLVGFVFVMLTVALALAAAGLPLWAGFGITTLLLLLAAGLFALVGRSQARKIGPPERSINAAQSIVGTFQSSK